MSYFKNVKVNQEVFGLVFGKGKVSTVWEEGFYTFEVTFDNGYTVPYTDEGIPAWGNGKIDYQTLFYKEDINIEDIDFSPSNEILSIKKIIKLRNKGKLQIKCPSGIWQPYNKCPFNIAEEYLENGKLSYFRKEK